MPLHSCHSPSPSLVAVIVVPRSLLLVCALLQECNRFLKRKILPNASRYHSRAIPIPMFAPIDGFVSFMGRVTSAILAITDARKTIFSPSSSGWFDSTGRYVVGRVELVLLKRDVSSTAHTCQHINSEYTVLQLQKSIMM